ncbi:MAG: hypothetical protein V1934_01655 [Methanobacteriota archaeon]
MLVEKGPKMASSTDKPDPAPANIKPGSGQAHHTVTHPGADRSNLLIAIRQAEVSAAKKKEEAEKRAEAARAEGRKAAIRLAEQAEAEGRGLLRQALEKAAMECEHARKDRLAKAHAQAAAIAESSRIKFPELAKKILQGLERGDDAKS